MGFGSGRHAYADANCNGDGHTNCHSYCDLDAYTHSDTDSHPDRHTDCYSYCHCDSHSHSHTNGHSDPHGNGNVDTRTELYPTTYTFAKAHPTTKNSANSAAASVAGER